MRLVRRGGRQRSAGAILELALTMPLLVMLSFGLVEYSYYMYIKISVLAATRDGVRNAITANSTNATVQSAVNNEMGLVGVPSTAYTVTTSPTTISGVSSGTSVTVTVTCNWSAVGINVLSTAYGGIPTSKQIICSITMDHE